MPIHQAVGLINAVNAQIINGVNSYVSDPIPVENRSFFGVWYQAVSAAGTPSVRIYFQESFDPTPGNFVSPKNAEDIESNLTDEVSHANSFKPIPMPYLRIVVQGLSGNPSDTVVNLRLFAA